MHPEVLDESVDWRSFGLPFALVLGHACPVVLLFPVLLNCTVRTFLLGLGSIPPRVGTSPFEMNHLWPISWNFWRPFHSPYLGACHSSQTQKISAKQGAELRCLQKLSLSLAHTETAEKNNLLRWKLSAKYKYSCELSNDGFCKKCFDTRKLRYCHLKTVDLTVLMWEKFDVVLFDSFLHSKSTSVETQTDIERNCFLEKRRIMKFREKTTTVCKWMNPREKN